MAVRKRAIGSAGCAGGASTWPQCTRAATYITEIAETNGANVAQQLAGHARLDRTRSANGVVTTHVNLLSSHAHGRDSTIRGFR
jgi:hypothetical protein